LEDETKKGVVANKVGENNNWHVNYGKTVIQSQIYYLIKYSFLGSHNKLLHEPY